MCVCVDELELDPGLQLWPWAHNFGLGLDDNFGLGLDVLFVWLEESRTSMPSPSKSSPGSTTQVVNAMIARLGGAARITPPCLVLWAFGVWLDAPVARPKFDFAA